MAEADHVAFHLGQDAFERGEGAALCPFSSLLIGPGLSWLAGWDEARRYAARSIIKTPTPVTKIRLV